jgi:hypothetical protein
MQKEGGFPCIIHWNFNHFVVLKGFKKGKAMINDPAKGECSIPLEEFDQSFTGICLKFEPGETFEPGGKPQSVWSFAVKRLKGTGPAIPFTVLSALIAVIANVILVNMHNNFSYLFFFYYNRDSYLLSMEKEGHRPSFAVILPEHFHKTKPHRFYCPKQ